MSIEKSDSQMYKTPVSDEERIYVATSELFNLVRDLLDESTQDFIQELLFVGEAGIAIDVMAPYYKESNFKLSNSSLLTIEELHELTL